MPIDIEQFDQLHQYLIDSGRIGREDWLAFKVLAGGVSSRTVLIEKPKGLSWVLKQSLPKLRVQMDWFSDPMRIHREALGLRWLHELAPGRVPQFVFEDFDEHILAMSAVPEPHENWKTMLLNGQVELNHVEQFGQLLAAIHGGGWQRRDEIEPVFADRQYFESLRIEPYYECSATMVPAAKEFLLALVTDTRTRQLTLVHGDYSPKNVLIVGNQLVLLDHEVIHFGDPAFDLGFALTHLLSKGHHLGHHRERFRHAAERFWHSYGADLLAFKTSWQGNLESMAVRHTLGCLLARTSGRSPLEYLSTPERDRQRTVVLAMMREPPKSIPALISSFVESLEDGL